MKKLFIITPILAGLIIQYSCETGKEELTSNNLTDRPNFIFIYADNLGYGDLGCFGATDIRTPNIDRMAREGMKFTEFYSASPTCSPSRAALLTGRYPVRMGIYSVFFPDSYYGIDENEVTIADVLQKAGYATGHIGKWHLGHRYKYLPLQNGFDEYFGIPYSNDMSGVMYMRDNDVDSPEVDLRYVTRTYTEEALKFIDNHNDESFFLYIAHTMPHIPIYASEDFEGKSSRGIYGDVIEEMDWSVGQIMNRLEEYQIDHNTLIIFSSDNGPWLVMRELGGSAGPLREGMHTTFEGGMRVPTVAIWPEGIPDGAVYDDMGLMMDWFPTLANLAGIEIPDSIQLDGEDISQVLTGQGKRVGKEFGYYNGKNLNSYRYGNWKIKREFEGFPGAVWKKRIDPHPWLLINLKNDPGEQNNLADSQPEKLEEMKSRMKDFQNRMGPLPPSADFRGRPADESHYKYLREKYGKDYYLE